MMSYTHARFQFQLLSVLPGDLYFCLAVSLRPCDASAKHQLKYRLWREAGTANVVSFGLMCK